MTKKAKLSNLRPYQEKAIEQMQKQFTENSKPVVRIPVRHGKPKRFEDRIEGLTFDSPRRFEMVTNWPAANLTTTRYFGVLTRDDGKEQAITWTEGNAPRVVAGWHEWCRIVTGSDGKHYVICYSGDYGFHPYAQGRAVIYPGAFKAECAVYTTVGIGHFDHVREIVRNESQARKRRRN